MKIFNLYILILGFSSHFFTVRASSSDSTKICHKAFLYSQLDLHTKQEFNICSYANKIPFGYEAGLNMPVCDDKLCANVYLKVYWDLAGNYTRFDTIAGKPLTKFDHKPFTSGDYKKLDQILKDQNSMLRVLNKSELIDKSIKLKSTTVDAVTGATPATLKNLVVEGAVYSVYSLWHFVNGDVKDSLKQYTLRIYSKKITEQMLRSTNYETQLFAIKQLHASDFEPNTTLIFDILKMSIPLVRGYIINKIPLPFTSGDKNRELVQLFATLDNYSKSILSEKIVANKVVAEIFIPLINKIDQNKDEKLVEKMQQAAMKYNIIQK